MDTSLACVVPVIVWLQRLLSGQWGDLPRLYGRTCRASRFAWLRRPDRPHIGIRDSVKASSGFH
jgi:hypothetical protein